MRLGRKPEVSGFFGRCYCGCANSGVIRPPRIGLNRSRFRWQVGKAEPNLPNSPGTLDFMRRHLGDFESARKAATTDEALIAAMKQQYPGLKQEKFLVMRTQRSCIHRDNETCRSPLYPCRFRKSAGRNARASTRHNFRLLRKSRGIARLACTNFERRVILTQRISKLAL